MTDLSQTDTQGCNNCKDLNSLSFDFSMAFQPIIDASNSTIFGYEALVRGLNGEPAATVLSKLVDENRYTFDQAIRVRAIQLASELNLQGMLSINFLPNAVYNPQTCIRTTLQAAGTLNFPTERIMFEVTEAEKVTDHEHLKGILKEYKKHNFTTAIDDFGAGYAGLNLLADWQPDIIKLDMALIRDINKDKVRQALVSAMIMACKGLDISVIAEGIETVDEFKTLLGMNVSLFQGYLFAKPQFESLPVLTNDVQQMIQETSHSVQLSQ
jgi:EAL domain-containing protein (putative c-di-GMP-specific phosphodiesterase class I)